MVRGPQDRTRVDPDELWELQWWSRGFGVSTSELLAAIREVGPIVADLEAYLRTA
jgi:hypothetical protein